MNLLNRGSDSPQQNQSFGNGQKIAILVILFFVAAIVIYEFTRTTTQSGAGTISQEMSAVEQNIFDWKEGNKDSWTVIKAAREKGSVFLRDPNSLQFYLLEQAPAHTYQVELEFWKKSYPSAVSYGPYHGRFIGSASSWWNPKKEGSMYYVYFGKKTNGIFYEMHAMLFTNQLNTYRLSRVICQPSEYK